MNIVERSYGGKFFRPQPEVLCEPGVGFCVVATPWGPRSSARRVIQLIQDFFLSARDDQESTSPFQKLSCLSPTANYLRTAIMLANDAVYNEDNKNEYQSGVEVFVCARVEQELIWTHIGQPHLFIVRESMPWISAGCAIDGSVDFSNQSKWLTALPQALLGAYSTTNFSIHSLRLHPNDKMVLMSRPYAPTQLLTIPPKDLNLERISQTLAKDDEDMPFWLAVLDPNE